MAWPDKLNQVGCYGFDKKYLPALKLAIDNDKVIWGKCNLFTHLGTGRFTFVNCEWELTEMNETVTDIKLISGVIE